RTQPMLATKVQDPPLARRLRSVRRPARTARTILKACTPVALVAAPPHTGAIAGHAQRRRGLRDRPTGLDALTPKKSTSWPAAGVRRALRCTGASSASAVR